jgi:hypothetical protein
MVHSEKLNTYLKLSELSYDDAVASLLAKYGSAKDDYFRPKSYQRFLDGEIKSITRGKYARFSADGLYAHHILENRYIDLANLDVIRSNNYPFEYHRREHLVYADAFEHLVLHAIITRESTGKPPYVGIGGFDIISALIEEWYIIGRQPKAEWYQAAYHHAYLSKHEATYLLSFLDKQFVKDKRSPMMELAKNLNQLSMLAGNTWSLSLEVPKYQYPHIPSDQSASSILQALSTANPNADKSELRQQLIAALSPYQMSPDEIRTDCLDKHTLVLYDQALEDDQKRTQQLAWARRYPDLVQSDIKMSISRDKILKLLYQNADHAVYPNYKDYRSARITTVRDDLLVELNETFR